MWYNQLSEISMMRLWRVGKVIYLLFAATCQAASNTGVELNE
jgi:hypothetical protein